MPAFKRLARKNCYTKLRLVPMTACDLADQKVCPMGSRLHRTSDACMRACKKNCHGGNHPTPYLHPTCLHGFLGQGGHQIGIGLGPSLTRCPLPTCICGFLGQEGDQIGISLGPGLIGRFQ
eukprot:1157271-Pelagomonas_calceolata.AAC.5